MKNIMSFMDDLYQGAQTEGIRYTPVSNNLHKGIYVSSKILMTQTEVKDDRYKLCIWDPTQFNNKGIPHLIISLNPYSCGPEITGKSCSFYSRFNLSIERLAHENTNGLLNNFMDMIVCKALRMIDKYDRVITDEKPIVKPKDSLALTSSEQTAFVIGNEWKSVV